MTFNIEELIGGLDAAQVQRLEDVYAAQRKVGMEPRKDSILTYNYAIGNVPDFMDSTEVVAHELKIVDYIYKNTDYEALIVEVMREVAGFVHFKYKLDWTTTWEIVRFYTPTMLKLHCLNKKGISVNECF